jgi:two-component system, chemotaxis family, sensor kinase CheA
MIDPLLEQLLPGFVDESQEIAERLTQNLIALEKAHEAKRFDDLARGLHTLKGSSATLGLGELSELAHKMEDVVLPFRGKGEPLPGALADALLRTLDAWMANLRATAAKAELPSLSPSHELLENLRRTLHGGGKAANDDAPHPAAAMPPRPAPVVAPATAPPPREKPSLPFAPPDEQHAPTDDPDAAAAVADESGSWRVRTRDVVALLHEVERLREVRLRIEERRRELDRAVEALSRLGLSGQTAEVRAQLAGVQRAISADGEEAGDIVASMEDGLKSITTLPVRTVLDPMRRAVRDLCRQTGKEARLSVVGGELSLDRRVLESLRGPLTQLVRNAVDHGVEVPAERERRGKHTEGAIVVRVEQQGNMLFVEVADDGGGLDTQAIKAAALERDIGTAAELEGMSAAQLHQMIFRSGFSTRSTVSEVSGRGVGMDVVRNEVQALQGHVEVQSTPGQGTRVLLTLPAELGSTPVLVVRCGEHQLGVPMSVVETSLLTRTNQLRISRSGAKLAYRQEILPLHDLGALLALRAAEPPGDGQPLLVLQAQGKRVALAVDEVMGDIEVAIRPLPPEVRDLPAYQGAAMLARGELVLIVRADWMIDAHAAQARTPMGRRALVVDDSLTARALHRTALEAGGYLVHCASSGRQALDQLRHSSYDVIVCDIGMDEMDGFELTHAVRREPQVAATPIVLVSAHDSSADRQRGHEVGADSFLSKKECMSGRLLAEVAAAIARRQGSA